MLESLSDRLQGVFRSLRGEARLTEATVEAALREIRMALLEADVNFKVDKAFIDRVGRTGGGVSVAHVVLALGKSMRLRTVAEGIEAEEQVAELLRLKCEFGQGLLFSKPLSPAGVGALLRSTNR